MAVTYEQKGTLAEALAAGEKAATFPSRSAASLACIGGDLRRHPFFKTTVPTPCVYTRGSVRRASGFVLTGKQEAEDETSATFPMPDMTGESRIS